MRKICKNYIPAGVEEIQTRMKRLRENRHLPKDRAPNPEEVEACTPFLDQQIKIVEPKFVVTLGRHSASYILSKAGLERAEGNTQLRGRVYEASLLGLRVSVIPMYHPAAALYNAKYRADLENDFQLLRLRLKSEVSP